VIPQQLIDAMDETAGIRKASEVPSPTKPLDIQPGDLINEPGTKPAAGLLLIALSAVVLVGVLALLYFAAPGLADVPARN
jgi:hypothetical protein